MTEYVFEFQNLYIPEEDPYQSDEYNIRIEPMDRAEDFEENRRRGGSKFRSGYWVTAKCFIGADEERAKELAEWLSFIYSFAQNRDVVWDTYYQGDKYPEGGKTKTPYRFSIDNTGLQLIKMPHPESSMESIDPFVDRALTTLDTASSNDRDRILRDLGLFLEGKTDTFWSLKFLFNWIVLESSANDNYDDYLENCGEEIIDEGEQEEIREFVVDHFEEEWDEDDVDEQELEKKVNHLDYVLGQHYIYEAASRTKIKIYLEYLDLELDIDEVMEVIDSARDARNPLLHRNTDLKIMNNHGIVTDVRKITFYILFVRLGMDKQFRKRIHTPQMFGPDIN